MTWCERLDGVAVNGRWFHQRHKCRERDSLQMPDSRPTAKQLESVLKETDRTAVGLDDSMGARTFMAATAEAAAGRWGQGTQGRRKGDQVKNERFRRPGSALSRPGVAHHGASCRKAARQECWRRALRRALLALSARYWLGSGRPPTTTLW